MDIPCKNCLVLAICKTKEEVTCDELEKCFVSLPANYNLSFDKIRETLPRLYRITGNGVTFANGQIMWKD